MLTININRKTLPDESEIGILPIYSWGGIEDAYNDK
jgi:hypothetical protein